MCRRPAPRPPRPTDRPCGGKGDAGWRPHVRVFCDLSARYRFGRCPPPPEPRRRRVTATAAGECVCVLLPLLLLRVRARVCDFGERNRVTGRAQSSLSGSVFHIVSVLAVPSRSVGRIFSRHERKKKNAPSPSPSVYRSVSSARARAYTHTRTYTGARAHTVFTESFSFCPRRRPRRPVRLRSHVCYPPPGRRKHHTKPGAGGIGYDGSTRPSGPKSE